MHTGLQMEHLTASEAWNEQARQPTSSDARVQSALHDRRRGGPTIGNLTSLRRRNPTLYFPDIRNKRPRQMFAPSSGPILVALSVPGDDSGGNLETGGDRSGWLPCSPGRDMRRIHLPLLCSPSMVDKAIVVLVNAKIVKYVVI